MYIKRSLWGFIVVVSLFADVACKQNEWLDVSNNKALIIPSTLEDYQAILDNDQVMNAGYPVMGLIGTDVQYIGDQNSLNLITEREKNAYLWEKDVYRNYPQITDWNNPYKMVAAANIVLDGLADRKEQRDASPLLYDKVRGSALFFRAIAYYSLAQLFCKPYREESAASDPGLPLRLVADVNVGGGRASVADTYKQIVSDLATAVPLLPERTDLVTRPARPAALALLSKVFLAMERYDDAFFSADKVLAGGFELLDFNLLSKTARFPFPPLIRTATANTEILFYATGIQYATVRGYSSRSGIPAALLQLYEPKDLRRAVFYTSSGSLTVFKGCYSAATQIFCGLATNEVLLIRAECYARMNRVTEALADLNLLLAKRYESAGFQPFTAQDPTAVLARILEERKKELPLTGQLRWEDLRRLNRDSRFAVTLKREVGNTEYVLPPDDPRYVLPVPDYEISLNPMPQNER
ncbi:RagB/SusD family nutrient uptake outer membrane protein [Pararcticibacter amylolyticus]|nr:RagB/SusD family nutrient uptake outer membrane protein [Pararcticibacter amylolyticus]